MLIKTNSAKNFIFGFLSIPSFIFVFKTTFLLALDPIKITEGIAIVYIAILTAIYYMFFRSHESGYGWTEKPDFSISKTLGTLFFLVPYFLITFLKLK